MNSSAYLSLLKKMLIDFDKVGTKEYHPLEIVDPNWKTFFLFPLHKLLRPKNFAICKVKNVEMEERMNGMDWPAQAKTMIGMKRLDNIEFCINDILENEIAGDFIETGVWRGGATMFMKAMLNESNTKDRTVWLADSFLGVPKPNTNKYKADKGNILHGIKILTVSKNEVIDNFKKFDLWDDQVQILEGWFADTLPNAPIKQLSLLRLDGDLYESTYLALTHLYPKLSVGGYVIIDDYNAFTYCKQAVKDFRENNDIQEPMLEIDQEAIFWKKEK